MKTLLNGEFWGFFSKMVEPAMFVVFLLVS